MLKRQGGVLSNSKYFFRKKKDKHFQLKKGKQIKGQRLKNRSKSLQKTLCQLEEMARKQATHRKTQHGRLINTILQIGNHIKQKS